MKFRALQAALLPAALVGSLLSGCGVSHLSAAQIAASSLAAKDAADASPFLPTANACTALIAKSADWKNPVLVSIEGHGLDQTGKLVPLLGGSWVFKYWANKQEDGKIDTDFNMVEVIHHVEGTNEVVDTGDTRETDIVRVLDPAKIAQPTQIVPFAIRLGLKVSHAGAGYNYFDVTYNAFFADPSSADANVADVSAYYQGQVSDMLHIPADTSLLPAAAAPTVAVPATTPAAAPHRATPTEMAADEQRDQVIMSRQHT